MTGDDISHGTYGGYQVHKKRRVEPCAACRAAAADYQRKYRAVNPDNDTDRQYTRARNRALERLRRQYGDLFEAYLADELANERGGKS